MIDSQKVLYSKGGNDENMTPDYGVKPIIKYLEKFKGQVIWCPFDKEDSQFVIQLKQAGHDVIFSHIEDGQDFYTYEPEQWDVIVSNPPFTAKAKIFERCLSFNKPFALIMSLSWLNDSTPKKLFMDKDLQLLMFDKRMKFNNNDSNKITFSSAYYCYDILPKQIIMERLIISALDSKGNQQDKAN